jgi:phosphoglycerol transferase MdoB-like AlkP superfamily enzyme
VTSHKVALWTLRFTLPTHMLGVLALAVSIWDKSTFNFVGKLFTTYISAILFFGLIALWVYVEEANGRSNKTQ